jgi:hypothetical protein
MVAIMHAARAGSLNLRRMTPWLGGAVALVGGLYLTGIYSSLLLHGVAETFSIVVACGIFMVAWNTREFLDDHLLLWLGIASLFIACLDFLHTLAYPGAEVFPTGGENVATQLSLAARFLQASALVAAPAFLTRRLNAGLSFALGGLVTALLLASTFVWGVFPVAYAEPGGFTTFKTATQLGICVVLGAAIWFLVRKRHLLHPDVFRLLVASAALTIGSELAFVVFTHTGGLPSLLGHLPKIAAFYCLYKATIETALLKPYALLFRSLKQSEEELRRALGEVKQLSGMLPICSSCKQIRNDQGYWQEVEVYLTEHSEAVFSHGLCPDCAHRLYPEYFPAPPRRA